MGELKKFTHDDYKELIAMPIRRIRKNIQAFCTSFKCTKDAKALKMIVKDVPRGTIDCPHCQSALFWADPSAPDMETRGE